MKPSITYLYLLRHTPFFTQLNYTQLRWAIHNSKEWEARAGTVIAHGGQGGDGAFWILLDGGWQVEFDQRIYPAGHADPGKWFSPANAAVGSQLVANQRSYVMRIERAAMDKMLADGFAFAGHLESGRRYYEEIFAAGAR